jgi:hypothetical protein
MKSLVALSTLFALVATSPTPAPVPQSHQLVSVHLRVVEAADTRENTRYTAPNQLPSSADGYVMTIVVGQTYSFDYREHLLKAYGLEITGVEGVKGDEEKDVKCLARLNYSSESVEVTIDGGVVALDAAKREAVVITQLWCELVGMGTAR